MTSYSYALKISYLGTAYSGWQKQPGGLATIQGELERALENLAIAEAPQTMGSGRTDAGVHAFGQVVRVLLDREIESYKMIQALNAKLPTDIRVLAAVPVAAEFHPVRDALSKEYCYLLSTDRASPFFSQMALNVDPKLDWALMQKAAALFVGEWDFKCYQTVGTPVNTTVRTIFKCSLEREKLGTSLAPAVESGEFWQLSISGSGFLKQMVRLVMGTILSVGKGSTELAQIEESLRGQSEQKLAAVAPPHGLYLKQVIYPKPLF